MTKIMYRSALVALAGVSLLAAGDDSGGINQISEMQREGRPAIAATGHGELRPHVWMSLHPNARASTVGNLSPSQIVAAYGIGLAGGNGQGATVAIVDAYDAPNAASDLATFSKTFGITCSTGGGNFSKVNENGQAAPLPAKNSGWEVEISLDTQWVHAVAPCANIVLVEASSSSTTDLMAAVNTAKTLGPVVSMSWGGSEFRGQTSLDGSFVKSGVTFLASSGDTGGEVEWPSSSPNVIAVGGTNLTLNANGSVASETAWNSSGGGCSALEAAIPVQKGFVPSSCRNRAVPDVAIDGGSVSAVQVYVSDQGGWYDVWGTSLAVQLWAGVVAVTNGERVSPLSLTLNDLYADASGAPTSTLYLANFRDIVSGSAGRFSAGPGWDFVTGLGSPLANSLLPGYLTKQQ